MDLLPALRALHIGATALLAGGWAFRLLLARGHRVGAQAERRLRSLGLVTLAVALATWLGWLGAVAAQMSGLPWIGALAPGVLGTVATQTAFGQVWLLRAGLLLALAALQWRAGGSRASEWSAAVVAACALAALAGSGHALGAQRERFAVDAVHVLAGGLWLGMLPLLWWSISRALATSAPADAQLATLATQRFAVPGAVAVIALAASGAFNAWWLVGAPANLLTTRYGLLVLAKIGLYLAMVLLALVNRFVLAPRLGLDARGTLRSLRRTVLAETALGLLALAVVGLLGITPPAAHERPGDPMHHAM